MTAGPSTARPGTAPWNPTEPVIIGVPTAPFEARPVLPAFRWAPYRPDTALDGWTAEHYVVRAASIRGAGHRFWGAPRQDEYALMHTPSGGVIAAVADGVSAAEQSHLGATATARYAGQLLGEGGTVAGEEIDWNLLAKKVAWQLAAQAEALGLCGAGEDSAATAERMLATTLVCSLVEPVDGDGMRVRALSVGDSGLWSIDSGRYTLLVGAKQSTDSPIASSAVSALPRIPVELTVVDRVLDPGAILLMGSDGIGDPLGDGTGSVGDTLWKALALPPSLLDFARLTDFSRETFDDDRTLIGIWIR